ncbi:hypothetical protein BAE44_0004020 [Dichanthelium oligosanthes]|uniref:Uncharacterized protein n=1 Tax=Dichanthelium oligosanthes TaxID=888268 RepID=A0A1E5WC68_9POAL|nr:hypothetical protein BAE44_0004020 [Dichanthelium oligosanthes]
MDGMNFSLIITSILVTF